MINAMASLVLIFIGTMMYMISFQHRGKAMMIPIIALILSYAYNAISVPSSVTQPSDKISLFLR